MNLNKLIKFIKKYKQTMKRLPYADVNLDEGMLSEDEDKSSITGN